MNIGIFNARGINKTEHFVSLEIEELKKRGHVVEHFWIKGRHPTKEEIKNMNFAVFHFVPTAYYFYRIGVPFCILPTANDIFPDNGRMLLALEKHPLCKFIGYQSFYHKKKYDEWGITKPTAHIPHCVRVDLFKRTRPLGNKIIAGGRLIDRKALDRIVPYMDNLTIFGEGPEMEKLMKMNPKVNFTGYLDGEQMKQLYDDSWLLIVCSSSEGLPNTIKEALLMELQVIASPVAGIPEFENISLFNDWNNINSIIKDIPKENNIKGRKEILNTFSSSICMSKLERAIEEYGGMGKSI